MFGPQDGAGRGTPVLTQMRGVGDRSQYALGYGPAGVADGNRTRNLWSHSPAL
jgi:hypothetical protein